VRRAVLLIAVLGAAAACAEVDDGGAGATEAMVLETCAPGADPAEVAVCRCAYERLADQLDADALAELDRDARDDPETVPPLLQEAVLACLFERVAPPPTKAPATTSTTSSSTSTTRLP